MKSNKVVSIISIILLFFSICGVFIFFIFTTTRFLDPYQMDAASATDVELLKMQTKGYLNHWKEDIIRDQNIALLILCALIVLLIIQTMIYMSYKNKAPVKTKQSSDKNPWR